MDGSNSSGKRDHFPSLRLWRCRCSGEPRDWWVVPSAWTRDHWDASIEQKAETRERQVKLQYKSNKVIAQSFEGMIPRSAEVWFRLTLLHIRKTLYSTSPPCRRTLISTPGTRKSGAGHAARLRSMRLLSAGAGGAFSAKSVGISSSKGYDQRELLRS